MVGLCPAAKPATGTQTSVRLQDDYYVPCAAIEACLSTEQAAGGPTPGAALDEAAAFSGSGASGLASGKEEAVARAPLTVRTLWQ